MPPSRGSSRRRQGRAGKHKPTELPVYPWFDVVPTGLKTRNQLAELKLRPAGPVRALVVWRRGKREAKLYKVNEAVAKRTVTAAMASALDKARKAAREKWLEQHRCPRCGQFDYDVYRGSDMCRDCRISIMVAFDRDEARAWAGRILGSPRVVLLDTETTGLDDSHIVEIAVLRSDGTVLFESLVNPGVPIPPEATAVHGIRNEDVAGAPAFAEILGKLGALLFGRRVIAYNAGFDEGALWRELAWHFERQGVGDWTEIYNLVDAWLTRARWSCAMHWYAQFVGDWSEYHRDYRWQPLWGGHRAREDCLAMLRVLQAMAHSEEAGPREENTSSRG